MAGIMFRSNPSFLLSSVVSEVKKREEERLKKTDMMTCNDWIQFNEICNSEGQVQSAEYHILSYKIVENVFLV